MAKRYKYRFLKAGEFERTKGAPVQVHTVGAEIIAGYRYMKKHEDIEVTAIVQKAKTPDPETIA